MGLVLSSSPPLPNDRPPGDRPTGDRPPGDPPLGDPPASDLAPRALRLLAGADVDGYRKLFDEAELVEDAHRRYWAVCGLIEQGLAATGGVAQRSLPSLFAAVAEGAFGALERDPCEPKLLNYAGVALYELWSLEGARALFEAARRLDAQMDRVAGNLGAVAQRGRSLRSARRPPLLHASVPALERRAQALAERAQPAEGLRISLCMIVRDEQEMLPRCLSAVAKAVDEMVIVDTGSCDGTVEIARSFGALVIEREWTGSFAEARNVSFDAASGDWLMYLDADEVLVREDAALLRSLAGRTWREAFYLSETNYTGELGDGTAVTHNALRVFRNRPEYRFEGRLHEQIAHRLPGYLPERLEITGVRIDHYGYLGVVRDSREKTRRNIELLQMQQAEGPSTPFLHYNLGSEYAAAGDALAALAEFERGWSLIAAAPQGNRYEFAPTLMSRLVKALRVCGRPADALVRAEEGLELFPGFTDLVLEQALACAALGERARAQALYERCIEMGDAPSHYTATVGCGTYLPRIQLAELRRLEGDVEGGVKLLEECVREHPQFTGSVLPYANALLQSGVEPDTVVASVERHMPQLSPGGRFLLGTALYEAGATAGGEQQFRAVLSRQPHSTRARVALAEALLAQRRYEEAAAAAGEVPVDDPLASMACRSELFASFATRQDGEAALERARAAGIAPHELELFAGWRELLATGATTASVTAQAVQPLAVMLEALLRVQDFEAFEALLGLLDRAPLSARERRQLLGEMYLRRGFLASAAEEWMAVCRQAPDAAALVGLARVAHERGMEREAADFAAMALEHEPGNPAAERLLMPAILQRSR